MTAIARKKLSGWGRYRHLDCRVARPGSLSSAKALCESGAAVTPRGLGRSYGDSAIDPEAIVLEQGLLDRFLSFDRESGLIRCESGVSLREIIECSLPAGWFLPTTPGTKFVTIGGAIAADVHGKNHHVHGTFGKWIREMVLLLPDGSFKTCSPESNHELFWSTVGGMGLTGFIVEAVLQLRRCASSWYKVDFRRCPDLDAALSGLAESDHSHDYSVAWIDCLRKGRGLGRSVLMLGNDAALSDLPEKRRDSPFEIPRKRQKTVPFDFPGFTLNSWTVSAFNQIYYTTHPDRTRLLDYESFFYPLDSVGDWNRVYGRRGFIQYQALLPPETAAKGLRKLLERISTEGSASFLAVLKKCGSQNRAPLSFLHEGYTLALDLANTGASMSRLVTGLDKILLDLGGRLYLAKDSLMSPETFRAMYPRLSEFMEIKNQVDPDRRFVSAQARRLEIV